MRSSRNPSSSYEGMGESVHELTVSQQPTLSDIFTKLPPFLSTSSPNRKRIAASNNANRCSISTAEAAHLAEHKAKYNPHLTEFLHATLHAAVSALSLLHQSLLTPSPLKTQLDNLTNTVKLRTTLQRSEHQRPIHTLQTLAWRPLQHHSFTHSLTH